MKTKHSIQAVLSAGFLLVAAAAGAQTPLYFGWSQSVPYRFDFTGDGRVELAIYNSETGELSVRLVSGEELCFNLQIALERFSEACADYDGDGKADPGSYDRENGILYAFLSASDYDLVAAPVAIGTAATEAWPADYDGDHKADPALYDASSGLWVIYPSESGYQPISGIFGGNGMTAVPMDYDNDGKTDPAVYDANSGQWWVISSASQGTLYMLPLGGPGCVAAPGDFDGDGKADPAVYYAPLGVWGTLNSVNNYELSVREQGGPGCVPVPGKYYFTNRADYALYNTTNGCWNIAYESPLTGIWSDLACGVLPSLLVGDWKGAKKGGIGWGLNLLFNHGDQPEDPHWAEMRTILSEMNGKLDQLLGLSTAILDQLNQLSRWLQYDSAKTQLLIRQVLANQAFVTIKTRYDSTGPQGYQTFYTCDTNHPPSDNDVAIFVEVVLNTSPDMPTCINLIKNAILPDLGTDPGVLQQWVDMAKLQGVTPNNLLDHYQAFFSYFSTLYSYQLKAAVLYVDCMRQAYTSEFQNAATYTWITNDFMTTLQTEVEEFRACTYDLVLAASSAGYDPVSTNNQLANVTNVAATLNNLEFFAHQWLGQTQTLSATFLTLDQPGAIANYASIMARNEDGSCFYPQSIATNRASGHAYGYMNPDLRYLVVANGYVFLQHYFQQLPPGRYDLYNPASGHFFGSAVISNYDDNMQPTSDPAITNWFGHLYASPFNYQRLVLPVADSTQWNRLTTSYHHWLGHYALPKITDTWPSSLTSFVLGMNLQYEWKHGRDLPNGFGGDNFTYMAYPIQISNGMSGAQARIDFCADNTQVIFNYDSVYTYKQYYYFSETGGRAMLVQPTLTKTYTWLTESGRWQEPKNRAWHDHHSWEFPSEKGIVNAALQTSAGQTSTVTVAIGGSVNPWLQCYMGATRHTVVKPIVDCSVSYSIRYVILWFY